MQRFLWAAMLVVGAGGLKHCPHPSPVINLSLYEQGPQCCNRQVDSCKCPQTYLCCPSFSGNHICLREVERIESMESLTNCDPMISLEPISCDISSTYRSVDGSCNNLGHPHWGQAKRPLRRFLPQIRYEDGVDSARTKSVIKGRVLPSARKITNMVLSLSEDKDLSKTHTHMHMLWGQFIDHDISHTLKPSDSNCCDDHGKAVKPTRTHECFSIEVPENDPYYNMSCLPFIRSQFVIAGDCGNLHREQINDITPFIDADLIYGSTTAKAKELRLFYGGRLRTGVNDTLPNRAPGSTCRIPAQSPVQTCFLAGDGRVNEWTGLTVLHTTFMKEHNRLADLLYTRYSDMHTEWTESHLDEEVYQMARRIVAAQLQVITYNEYLPVTLDHSTMKHYNLWLGNPSYDPDLPPQASNEFSTAAFRYGHSEIPSGMLPVDKSYKASSPGFMPYTQLFHQPYAFYQTSPDDVIRGLISTASDSVDSKFTKVTTDELFKHSMKNGLGVDLPAINIQRGRDHGLPGYNSYRHHCGLSVAKTFDDLADHTEHVKRSLAAVYDHVEDIDLFIGGMTERNIPGSLVGPVFTCIIAEQFSVIKTSDRFWFENTDTYPSPFTAEQIYQLTNYTLASVICNNHDVETIPLEVFSLQSERVKCTHVLDIDIDLFY